MDRETASKRVASRRLGAIAVAALSALALLAAGCGGDSSSKEETLEALKEAVANRAPPTTSQSGATGSGGASAATGANPAIEEFGGEAKGGERNQIVTSFEAYFAALASKDYDDACAQLAKPIKKLLERFSAAKKESKGCAAIVAGLPEAVKKATGIASRGKVTEVRVEDDRSYVLFRAPGARLYQFSMTREGGEWKPATISTVVLQP